MSPERIRTPETLETVTKAAIKELGLLNINTICDTADDVLPILIEFNGMLDSTVDGQGSIEDVKRLIEKLETKFIEYTFTYDNMSLVTIAPKTSAIDTE